MSCWQACPFVDGRMDAINDNNIGPERPMASKRVFTSYSHMAADGGFATHTTTGFHLLAITNN